MTRMRVGVVGCGNIAADLCIALQKGDIPATIVALTDTNRSRAEQLVRSFRLNAEICDVMTNAGMVDLIVECADADAVKEVVFAAVHHHIDCLILSVGGLMAHPDLLERAREADTQVRIPSGSLSGLDCIRAAKEAGLHFLSLTTRKPPKSLADAPYLVEHGIDVENLTEPMVVFEGRALEAVQAFPGNVNVAAALSLAGIGSCETLVRIIADPSATHNTHEVMAEGAFGRLHTITENLPSPRNAKSSYLASLSATAELRAAATAFVAQQGALV